MLSLNWNIIWTFLNLIVLYFLLKKFLFKPVNDIVEKRANEIKNSVEKAKSKNEEAEQLKIKYETQLKNAENKANDIIKSAKQKADEEYEYILKNAKQEAAIIMEKTDKDVMLEKEKAVKSVKSEIAEIAIAAAIKATADSIDEKSNKKLIEDFLNEMEGEI